MRSYSNLPEEIIVDILSCLPAKSIGVCRCVSKTWRALLCRPEFIRTHLRRSVIRPQEWLTFIEWDHSMFCAPFRIAHHLFDKITLSLSPTKLIFPDHSNRWSWVHASCNGLLLVYDGEGKKFVLNPITKEIREVPRPPFRLDPSKSVNVKWALGYDAVNDDYKVVTMSYYGFDFDDNGNMIEPDSTEMLVNVYSLKSGSWKKAESSPDYQSVASKVGPAVFVDGCIHWFSRRTIDQKDTIVAFDLAEEKFREVPLPNSIDSCKLAVLGGCLCTFDETRPDVWVMKEHGAQKSWTKFTINHPEPPKLMWPLCWLGEEAMVMRYNNSLLIHNLKRRNFMDIKFPSIAGYIHSEVSFVESLVSPYRW